MYFLLTKRMFLWDKKHFFSNYKYFPDSHCKGAGTVDDMSCDNSRLVT